MLIVKLSAWRVDCALRPRILGV